jgi:hypothetical protein
MKHLCAHSFIQDEAFAFRQIEYPLLLSQEMLKTMLLKNLTFTFLNKKHMKVAEYIAYFNTKYLSCSIPG